MNILYDGPYEPHPKAGVVKYFREISQILSPKNKIFFSRYSYKFRKRKILVPPFPHFRPNFFSFYLEFLWFRYFSKIKIDIVHPTEFQLSPTGSFFLKKGAKLVITIHDLIHERFGAPGDLYSKASRTNFYKQADGYIFVSKSTRDDFAKSYSELFNSRRSKVIWHGSNYETENDIFGKNLKQFIFVGSRSGYKNFITAAKAFCKIAVIDSKVRLVIAGAPPNSNEITLLKNVQRQIDWKVYPSDKELRALYLSSLALLYTSNYEGFGMPLVESMSQGCIPIAGNHSSIPEVLWDAGLKVNTHSVSEVTSAMYKCITDATFVDNLQKKGFSRINEFNWYSTARKTLKFYKSL